MPPSAYGRADMTCHSEQLCFPAHYVSTSTLHEALSVTLYRLFEAFEHTSAVTLHMGGVFMI